MRISFSLKKDGDRTKINERILLDIIDVEIDRMLKIIQNAYSNALLVDKFLSCSVPR